MNRYIAKGFLKGEPFEFEDEAERLISFIRYLDAFYPSFDIKEMREVGWKKKRVIPEVPKEKRCQLNEGIDL